VILFGLISAASSLFTHSVGFARRRLSRFWTSARSARCAEDLPSQLPRICGSFYLGVGPSALPHVLPLPESQPRPSLHATGELPPSHDRWARSRDSSRMAKPGSMRAMRVSNHAQTQRLSRIRKQGRAISLGLIRFVQVSLVALCFAGQICGSRPRAAASGHVISELLLRP